MAVICYGMTAIFKRRVEYGSGYSESKNKKAWFLKYIK